MNTKREYNLSRCRWLDARILSAAAARFCALPLLESPGRSRTYDQANWQTLGWWVGVVRSGEKQSCISACWFRGVSTQFHSHTNTCPIENEPARNQGEPP
jgi:hypothetical protein